MRTTIRAYEPLERRRSSARMIAELGWYNDVLGAARDAEVILDRVHELLDGDSDILHELAGRREDAARRADQMLASRRASGLLDDAESFLAGPWRGSVDRRGKGPAAERLLARTDWAEDRVASAWSALKKSHGDRASAEHLLRRRAKAARYVLESVEGAVPGVARRAERYADLASLLGILQDVVVIDRALESARPSREPSSRGRVEQVLAARAEQARRADEARAGLAAAVHAAIRGRAEQ